MVTSPVFESLFETEIDNDNHVSKIVTVIQYEQYYASIG